MTRNRRNATTLTAGENVTYAAPFDVFGHPSTGNHGMQFETCLSRRSGWAEGQPISHLMHKALAHPHLISLAAGFVDQPTLPVEPTRQALDALLNDPIRGLAALQYGTTAGLASLREAVLARFRQADGDPDSERSLDIDQVIVTAGSNQLLHLVCDTLLDPGDIVLCAAPSYFVFLGMIANLGARAVGVAADENGMIPEALDEQLQRLDASGELERVKAIYVTTYFDNPGSVTLSAQRRPQIVESAHQWSKDSKIFIIEDTAYRDLRYFGEDIPSLRSFDPDGKTVIVAQTFSKSYSPGIRVGWGILPEELVEPVCNQKGNLDFGSPNFSQHLMDKVLELGLFDEHVEQLRGNYRLKLQAMLDAADEHFGNLPGVGWLRPTGGLYVWLQLPEIIETGPSGQLFEATLEEGTLYVPGEYCYPNEGPWKPKNMIRLSFGVQSPERIRDGMEGLARAVSKLAKG